MLMQVPRGKRVYIGAHRFIEGEIIPPHFAITLPDDPEPEIIETMAPDPIEEKPKRQYIRKPKPVDSLVFPEVIE
jgi:hypothetical protein